MARYEFVEGKSSKFWEATLDGTALTVRFGRIGTDGQTQTKTFTSPELAKKEHDKLVAEKLKKGYAAVKGAGAPATPPPPPAKGKVPAAALRKDFYVYNEATGFLIASKRLAGKGIDGGGKEWMKAVRAGDMIPLELYQDDPFVIRVVIGGELQPQEEEEWTGCLDWKLRVPDGNLIVCGGSEYVMDEFDAEEDSWMAEYVRHMQIPRGDYRASVYMYMGSVNGKPCLQAARGGDEPDPLGEWFRRTRPGEQFPIWLHNDCVSDPAEDPGHEDEWKKAKRIEQEQQYYVEFLLHLTPLKDGEKVELPSLGDDGWFSTPNKCRVPERIPVGFQPVEIEGLPKKPDPTAVHPLDIFTHTAKFKRAPIKGGVVDVPLEHLVRLFRVAWFCHVWSAPQIRIELPKGATFTLGDEKIDKLVPQRNGDVLTIGFESTGRQTGVMGQLINLGRRLKDLPDGTGIEFDTANIDPRNLKREQPYGLHRYKGAVKGGKLIIEEAFPVADAVKLNVALALAAQIEKENQIETDSEEITNKVIAALKKHPFFSDNPALKKSATAIVMRKAEPLMLNYIAEDVFKRTFEGTFPLLNLDDDEDDDDEDDEMVADARPKPPVGELLLKGASKRMLHASDASKLPEAVGKAIAAIEKDLLPLGFKHVADIVCKPMEFALIRGYAQDGGTAWAALILTMHGGGTFEFITCFGNVASLTTTRNMTVRDELYRDAYKSSRPSAAVKDMFKEHQRRSGHFVEVYGAPMKLNATPLGLATDVEESIKRQEAAAPGKSHTLLLKGDDGRKHYSADAKAIDPTAAEIIAEADKTAKALGFEPVGDVVCSFMTSYVYRGYAPAGGGDTWVKFQAEASSQPKLTGHWELATQFEKGACLVTTRAAMSKDEPKRKIYRIFDHKSPLKKLLEQHAKRKAELTTKHGAPVKIEPTLKGLAQEVEAACVRIMG